MITLVRGQIQGTDRAGGTAGGTGGTQGVEGTLSTGR